jgi:transposase-like protein
MLVRDDESLTELKQLELLNLVLKQGQEVRPNHNTGIGIIYSIGELTIREDKLLPLIRRGFFRIKGHIAFPICPICGDVDLFLNVYCPNCNSQDLLKVDVVIHYECHYADDISAFRRTEGLTCPVCEKKLKVVGVDYGRPGISYKCNNCTNVFQFPLIGFTCSKGHMLRLDELALHRSPVLVYEPSKSLRESAAWKVLDLVEALKSRGYKAEPFALLRGTATRAEYMVDVLVHKSWKRIALMSVFNASIVSPDAVSRPLMLALDLQIPTVVLMSKEYAEDVARFFRLEGNVEQRIQALFPGELVKVVVYENEADMVAKVHDILEKL